MAKDLILEIGTEEMPAEDMSQIRNNFSEVADELFKQNRIDFNKCNVYSTPRRLTLFIQQLAEKQNDKHESVRGPAASIAFDDQGNPTRAGSGFARGQGVEVEDLVIKNDYVYVEKVEKGKKSTEILPELLKKMIKRIDFPKTMRWGNLDFKFIRPIKWILCLYGTQPINFKIAGKESGAVTRGHRFLSGNPFTISNSSNYFDKMEEAYVIVDQKKRRNMILNQLNDLEDENNKVDIMDNLIDEVVDLVEFPTAFSGDFNKDYLDLPEDVLVTSMVKHQRYFPMRDKKNKLINSFAAIRDGNQDNIAEVRHGNEMVLRARLADARFFYDEDLKKPFVERREQLKNIVFQEQLGTMYDKSERLRHLCNKIAEKLSLSDNDKKILDRAAFLCKNDLVTEMVDEFPNLQGIMGGEYSLKNGEKKEVARAISEHYKPDYSGDILPQSIWGQLLSLADKMDNITSHFSQGMKPTGSQDPYALRRQASGVIRILIKGKLDLNFSDLISFSLNTLELDSDDIFKEIKEFLLQRLQKQLERENIRYDVINAVISVSRENCYDVMKRAQAIMDIRKENPELFVDLIQGLVRAGNLASKAGEEYKIDENLFENEGERNLYHEYIETKDKIKESLKENNYKSGLRQLVKLKEPIDEFLDNVIVMVDDKDLQNNRLALLQRIAYLADPIMDVNEIAFDE